MLAPRQGSEASQHGRIAADNIVPILIRRMGAKRSDRKIEMGGSRCEVETWLRAVMGR